MCITELVQTIHDHSEAAFKGTTHEDDWYFYHDALSQMTAKSTVRWMKQRNIYRRWLIPLNGCNCGTVYVYQTVGNSPEFMPLDNSLNQDIQLSLSLHCAVTAHLPDNDPRKFSMRTPKTIQSGIQRIWGEVEGVPSSRRICDDCDRALAAFGIVYRAGWKMVPQLANRSGHRNHAAGRNSTGWGGVRVKNLLVAEIGRWLHADALQSKSERTVDIIAEIEESDNENSLLGARCVRSKRFRVAYRGYGERLRAYHPVAASATTETGRSPLLVSSTELEGRWCPSSRIEASTATMLRAVITLDGGACG